jgi:hypothetical protein
MPQLKSDAEGVITLKDSDGNLKGLIFKDLISRKNVFYSCTEMTFEELKALFKDDQKI